MANELIRLENVSKYYTGTQSVVMGLNTLSLRFDRGEFVAITGESGSGKSTLSHVLGGILPYESGEMYFNGDPTSHFDSADWECYRRDHISFISQNYGILPGATVMENVVSALLLTGLEKQEAAAAAEDLLRQVELWPMHRRRASKLSSGQKQRLSIARALAKPAPVLIADEPTGNLDPENSALVIRLLAQAAQERLVILVTHEFSEAEELATRHVVLQDGRVVMDAPLRPAPVPQEVPPRQTSARPLGGYVARLQQRSRPVWSGVMALFFALTAFAVFAFLGTFIVHLDDSYTRIYDDSIFKNGEKNRVVVSTLDGEPMTQDDYDALANIDYVQSLEPNGYVTDVQYAYREKIDYEVKSVEQSVSQGAYSEIVVTSYVVMKDSAPYMKTVPILPDGETFLTAGRLPENFYEIVACGGEEMLGTQIKVYLKSVDYWAVDQELELMFTVVGVTDLGSDLYFHEDVGRFFVQLAKTAREGYLYLPVMDLDDETFRATESVASSMWSKYQQNLDNMARQNRIFWMEKWGAKLFEKADGSNGESLQLNIEMQDSAGITLWHIAGNKGLWYSEKRQCWVRYDTKWMGGLSSYAVHFYPVGDTEPAQDGTLTSGQYVIWCDTVDKYGTVKYVAISSLRVYVPNESGYCYVATPLEYTDGVLTGYTQEDVWDVQIVEGYGETMAAITHDGVAMVVPGFFFRDTTEEIEALWALGEARDLVFGTCCTVKRLVEVSYNNFDALTWNENSEQVSITVTDYGYMDRVLEKIQGLGYAAVSVYQIGSTEQNPTLAQEREQTLMVCLLALAAVVVLQVILLRAMFQAQTESYRLLSNIGLTAKTAFRSVLLQIFTFALAGQLLAVAALMVCRWQQIERITHIMNYLPVGYAVLMALLHLGVSALAALWIMAALRKSVYPMTGRESDLTLDED